MHGCDHMLSSYCIFTEDDLLLHASFHWCCESNATLELMPVCFCTAVMYVRISGKMYCKVGIIIIANCYFVFVLV